MQCRECDLCTGGHYLVRCDCPSDDAWLDEYQGGEPKELRCPDCGLVVTISNEDREWFNANVNLY